MLKENLSLSQLSAIIIGFNLGTKACGNAGYYC